MTISLAPELEGFINQEELRRRIQKGLDDVKQGRVRDGREVMAELIAKHKRGDDQNQKQEELRAEIQLGLDSLNRGEGDLWEIESIKAEGRRRLAALKSQQ